MPKLALRLPRPRGVRLRSIVRSHGWYSLPPFAVEEQRRSFVLRGALPWTHGGESRAISFAVEEAGPALAVTLDAPAAISARARTELAAQLASMLSLDESLDELYDLTDDHARLGYARRHGAGRMLRGATVWEDLVKVLLTTNCSWSLTTKMTERLVDNLGSAAPCGRRAFPTPAQMAAVDERFYRDVVRAGYRAPHLGKLARALVDGSLTLPTRGDGDAEMVRRALLALPGYGPYAADNLLRLLGCYGYLGLDSWCRAQLAEVYGGPAGKIDAAATRRYAPYGRWAGLAMWLDVTRAWHVRTG